MGVLRAYVVAVPLGWAALLMFHPWHDPGDVYGTLRADVDRWLVVHVGTLVFIGLLGTCVLLLVRGLPGAYARVARVAAGVFVLGYGAGEATLGIATGVLVRHAEAAPERDRAAIAGAIQALWESPLTDELAITAGAAGWLVAVIAAGAALRQAGAPLAVPVLLLLSGFTVMHGPPIGPAGLVCFAVAAAIPAVRVGRRAPAAASG